MYISTLTVRNFRNFYNEKFHFNKGVNTLIGENGSGKTNVFHAIRLLLDDSLAISANKLLETDFNRALKQWKGHWIVINIEFKELNSSEAGAMMAHNIEHLENEGIGTYSFYFRPKKRIRKDLYELSNDPFKDHQSLDHILTNISIEDYEAVFCFRGRADFSDDDVYKRFVGDFDEIIFPDPDDQALAELGDQTSQVYLIRNEVTCTFIKALRNVVADMRKARTSPLLNLLRGSTSNVEIENFQDIADKVKDLNNDISSLNEIKTLTNKVASTLNDTVGYTYAPKINIKSELPEDINKLVQSLALWVNDNNEEEVQGKLEDLSLGGANLIYITLKLLEYEYRQPTEEKAAHFLLIEEPEAHIHTHVQKTIFDNYQFENTQVITSTHSTHISSVSKIRSINILTKDKLCSNVCYPSNGLSQDECMRIERYLDATRSTLLFAKGIVLAEGDAELMLVPILFKKVFGISLDEIGISIINMSSTVFKNLALLFDDSRIQRNCSIITDHDQSIVELSDDPQDDDKIQRDFRNSQTKGEERKHELDQLYLENKWIKPFYSTYTFEVDFILEGNQNEIQQSLTSIFIQETAIDQATKKLHCDDISVQGKEILRLANKVGKGWFALLIAEEISMKTIIPEYILDAIAYASSNHISEKHLMKMAHYRINEGVKHKQPDFIAMNDELDELEGNISFDTMIEVFQEFKCDDQFLNFYELYEDYQSCWLD